MNRHGWPPRPCRPAQAGRRPERERGSAGARQLHDSLLDGLRVGRDALQDGRAAQVGRHDDDRVLERHRAALAVRHAPVVQHLRRVEIENLLYFQSHDYFAFFLVKNEPSGSGAARCSRLLPRQPARWAQPRLSLGRVCARPRGAGASRPLQDRHAESCQTATIDVHM